MPIDPQDGGPDDWFVPTSDGYPDDWFVPASGATGTAQPAPGSQPGAANPAPAIRPAPRPDPLTAFLSLIPASKWVAPPPIFPDAFGRFPLTPAAPPATPRLAAGYGLFGGLANLPDTSSPPTYGLFGVLKNPPWVNPVAFPSFQGAGSASGNDVQSAPPPFLSSLANLPWSPPPALVDGVSNATDGSAFDSAAAGQTPFPDGTQPVNAASRFAPMLNSQPANAAAIPFLQPAGLTSGASDQSATQSLVQNLSPLDWATARGISDGAGNYPMAPDGRLSCVRSGSQQIRHDPAATRKAVRGPKRQFAAVHRYGRCRWNTRVFGWPAIKAACMPLGHVRISPGPPVSTH
jgi:hypothetical protein